MNAIIMAAGMSSRFVPLCWERPKALLEVKGEILIERQIRQLKEAGIQDITIVTGYKAEMFGYLKDKFGVKLVNNPDYERYNNTSTLMCVLNVLGDTWICSSDNYFTENVFLERPEQSQYSAEYAQGKTNEYCLYTDDKDNIIKVTVGGADSWYMIGHVFFSRKFSEVFQKVLPEEYQNEVVRKGYWEDVYVKHLRELPPMKIRKFQSGIIQEFDTLEELRVFDNSYLDDTRSQVLAWICQQMDCRQKDIRNIKKRAKECYKYSFEFEVYGNIYVYFSDRLPKGQIRRIKNK